MLPKVFLSKEIVPKFHLQYKKHEIHDVRHYEYDEYYDNKKHINELYNTKHEL